MLAAGSRREWRGSGGEIEIGEDGTDGNGIGNEGDDELRLAYAFSTKLIADALMQYNKRMTSCPSAFASTSSQAG